MQKLVSIIMPVYNAEAFLCDIMSDIIKQTYCNWELICINDGSTDNSGSILREYESKFDNIHVISVENGGSSRARNIGLEYANGEFVRFVDADDRIPPHSIEQMIVAEQENPDSDIVIGNYKRFPYSSYFQGEYVDEKIYSGEEFADFFIKSVMTFYIGSVWNKLYRKDIIEENNICFKEGIIWCEDYFFNLEYFRYCNFFYLLKVEEGVYHYYDREESVTSKIAKWPQSKIDEIDLIRAEVAIIFCKKYNLDDKFKICWQFRNFYSGISTMVKSTDISIKEKYQSIKAEMDKPGISKFIDIKRADEQLFAWKIIDYSVKNKRYFIVFMFFYLKGLLARASEKFGLGIKQKLKKRLPNGF